MGALVLGPPSPEPAAMPRPVGNNGARGAGQARGPDQEAISKILAELREQQVRIWKELIGTPYSGAFQHGFGPPPGH
jgi:hypothetical protein